MKSANSYRHNQQQNKKRKLITTYFLITIIILLSFGIIFGSNAQFRFNFLANFREFMIAGIPLPIYLEVITDAEAVFAVITGDGNTFRNRLQDLGIENKIRTLYRPYFADEIELENYIDQIFYDSTGYANSSEYNVNQQNKYMHKA